MASVIGGRTRRLALLLLPLLAVLGVIAFLLLVRPVEELTGSAPPVEEIAFEQVRLDPGYIRLTVRVDGSSPIRIAQVQVDGAYRQFDQTPTGPLGRLASATIEIPYPWMAGESHRVVLLTSTGAAFQHTIEVAQANPGVSEFWMLVLIGLVLGVAPVAAGLLAFPAMRSWGPQGIRFVLAITIGLLAFLFVDTFGEGLQAGAQALGRLQGDLLVWVAAAGSLVGLLLVGRRGGRPPEGIRLAVFIALGIGLHNFGEGLAVGTSLATGAAALATFLLVGFVLHNITEGIGIAAPMTTTRPPTWIFVALAGLAGLPAVLGVWAGSQAVSPVLVALSFGIGAGAILQVIIEVGALIVRRNGFGAFTSATGAGGILVGLLVMYGTALLV